MDTFKIKSKIAFVFDFLRINQWKIKLLNRSLNNNYIRVINYHNTYIEDFESFKKQIDWFEANFQICSYNDLCRFLNGEFELKEKPGLVFTFDDGYLNNYQVAHNLLTQRHHSAIYMVSTGLIGRIAIVDGVENCYIDKNQLIEMANQGAVIGCHTFSHHRMDIKDNDEILKHEIVESKIEMEKILGKKIEIFCWCGGEEHTYTKRASDIIRTAGYNTSFMTNSCPILFGCDRFQIDRTNIEASWPLSLVRFQLSGIIDKRTEQKRIRVHEITK